MILSAPTKITKDKAVEIGANFTYETKAINLPPRLWYRFPEAYERNLSLHSDAFAATALLVSMYLGEDLHIGGKLSPALAYNLEEYKTVFCSWYPKIFQPIKVTHEALASHPIPTEQRMVATAFSGGVDSFYTTWMHIAKNQPIIDAQLTHGLFVHGLDMRLDDGRDQQSTVTIYKDLFHELGLELIEASTNAYHFSELRINWAIFFGAPTIGAALALSPWLRKFYMPSGMSSYQNLFPNGSSPILDHLLSTESTAIVHHGTSLGRVDKVRALKKWPATLGKLRVCSNRTIIAKSENCSACHKCYRTITALNLIGELQNHKNFSQNMKLKDYIRWGTLTPMDILLAGQLRNQFFRQGRIGVAALIQFAMILRFFSKVFVNLLTSILTRNQLYLLKKSFFKAEYLSIEDKK